MRFANYLLEAKVLKKPKKDKLPKWPITTGKKTINRIMKRLEPFEAEMDKKKWNVSQARLLKILNNTLGSNELLFVRKKQTIKDSVELYVQKGYFSTEYGHVVVFINRDATEYLKRYAKPELRPTFRDLKSNIFLKEIILCITHEEVHKRQMLKHRNIFNRIMDKYEFGEEEANTGAKEYLSNPIEIMSFAEGAATEFLMTGKSTTATYYYSVFSDKGTKENLGPVFDRFVSLVKKSYFKATGKHVGILFHNVKGKFVAEIEE